MSASTIVPGQARAAVLLAVLLALFREVFRSCPSFAVPA